MKTLPEARKLAESLISTGKRLGRTCCALLTDMDQPLGRTIGNALEILESLEILQGKGPEDVRMLTLMEAAHMATAANLHPDLESALAAATAALDSGKALEKFHALCRAQGGDLTQPLPDAAVKIPLLAPESGYVTRADAETLGRVALTLGAGRTSVEDLLDFGAGIDQLKQQGEFVEKGTPLCILCAKNESQVEAVRERALGAFTLSNEPCTPRKLIAEIIS